MTPQEIADASPCFACWSPGEVQVGILIILALANGVSAEDLASFSACFACLAPGEVQTDKLVVLTVPDSLTPEQVTEMGTCFDCWAPGDIQVGILTVMADSAGLTPSQIMGNAACFACLSPGEVQVQILTALSLTDSLDAQEIASQAGCFDCWTPGQIQTGILAILADTPYPPAFACTNVEITTGPLDAMEVGVAFSQQLEADGTGPITWSLASGTLPTGLSLSAGGLLDGTPTTAGAFMWIIRAENACPSSDEQGYSSTVCAAPVITTSALGTVTVGVPFSLAITYTGSTPATFTLTSGTLPAGLTVSAGGTVSGTPSAAGAYSFTLTATNDCGSDPQAFSGSVTASCTAPVITNTTLAAMEFGAPFSDTIDATGTTPMSFTVTAGSLPDGLTLSLAGVLSGTPAEDGGYFFVVTVINACGSDTQAYEGLISNGSTVDFLWTSTSSDNQNATVGVPYDEEFDITPSGFGTFDGDGIILWEVAGQLPPGLTWNTATNHIQGTPTTIGQYTFTIYGNNGSPSDLNNTLEYTIFVT